MKRDDGDGFASLFFFVCFPYSTTTAPTEFRSGRNQFFRRVNSISAPNINTEARGMKKILLMKARARGDFTLMSLFTLRQIVNVFVNLIICELISFSPYASMNQLLGGDNVFIVILENMNYSSSGNSSECKILYYL
jgi:hypothetical protein